MFKPRWYKVINDLFGNKTRTLLIVLSMAVGLFAIGIILSARSILSAALLNRNSTDPFELLSKTLALKNRMFNEVSSKHTPQMRFIHQFDEKAFGDFQDDVLGDAFDRVLKKRSKWCEFVNNRIPEVIGMAASKALSDLIGDMHFAMDFTAEYSTTVLLRDVLAKGLEMILPNRR